MNVKINQDLVCFSHLRWNFVYQRPQHLLSRFANYYRVFYIEEPMFDAQSDGYEIHATAEKVWVVVPRLKGNHQQQDVAQRQHEILQQLFNDSMIKPDVLWYYTPMALLYTDGLHADTIVYDCMDELSAFKFAPPVIKDLEKQLMQKADIVFTGGYSLYYAKKDLHTNIHPFPSSIDKEHFIQARFIKEDQADQQNIPHPRLGFFGVIDERFDIELIKNVAQQKPEWHFIFIGPVVKIDPAELPHYPNVHYLGNRSYDELPNAISSWDIALIPFAINDSTKYISPTKTPEYLAAGKPVISTAIADVEDPYGKNKLVSIIHNTGEFIAAAEQILNNENKEEWLAKTDDFLKNISWNNTWHAMNQLIKLSADQKRKFDNAKKINIHV
jgi:glycosyltransferase involved in cell wall biosynthesis